MLSEMKSKTDKLNAAQEIENEIIVMEDSLLKQLQQEPKSSISKPESSKKVSKQLEQVAETLMPESSPKISSSERRQRSQSFTSLMADLRQDINRIFSSFSRCLNRTFP